MLVWCLISRHEYLDIKRDAYHCPGIKNIFNIHVKQITEFKDNLTPQRTIQNIVVLNKPPFSKYR